MLALLFLLQATGAVAADAPPPADIHFIGQYSFTWAGLALAKAELAIDKTRDKYALKLQVRLAGIVNLFTSHRSITTVEGSHEGESYHPHVYESHYWTKKKPRHLKVAYDAKGVMVEETVEPPEDRTERPEVPHALKDKTIDPLTLLLALGGGNLTPRVFDAKHLYDGKAVKGEQTVLRTEIGKVAAIPYDLSRTPVSGLTAKEQREYATGEPPLAFYVSADDRHIPLYMTMPAFLGYVKGWIAKECKTWEECSIE